MEVMSDDEERDEGHKHGNKSLVSHTLRHLQCVLGDGRLRVRTEDLLEDESDQLGLKRPGSVDTGEVWTQKTRGLLMG